MANFVLLGAAGYIAPRHMEAIKHLGHNLVAAFDPNDSVGKLDSYFPDCAFFTDMNRLNEFVKGKKIDFVSICTPNYLHATHIQWAFTLGADAICEKPLVLSENELNRLSVLEHETGRRVYTVLQLRVHDSIRKLRDKVNADKKKRHEVKLSYVTSRGPWYMESWKGDLQKSGGLCSNIGIHFFDMLTWIFGRPVKVGVEERTPTFERGFLELERAHVQWDLSIDRRRLPADAISAGKTTFRSISIDGSEFEFSEGFTELHKIVYDDVLNGRGYGLEDARAAVSIAEQIRGMT